MATDWLFAASELRHTPSQRDGVALASELLRRAAACRLLARLSSALGLSLAAQRAACVFLHRFFMRRSLTRCDETLVATACLLAASKTEEDPQGVTVSRLARAVTGGSSRETEQKILQLEGDVLLALSFELEVAHAFSFVGQEVDAVAALLTEDTQRQQLEQAAWSFLNDSAITWACLCVDARLMAKAAVYAAGLLGDCVPGRTKTEGDEPWWTVLETPLEALTGAARHVLAAYTAPYVETSALPRALVELVAMFQKEDTYEPSESCVREPQLLESTQCVPLDDDFKVEIDDEILFQSVEGSPVVEQTTAWIDDCVESTKDHWSGEESPCDPCDVETCSQRPLALKRSLPVADSYIIKRAKLVR